MVTAEKLLGLLPPYRDQWQLVKKDQEIKDIIRQVLQSHEQFAGYYNKIALFFDAETVPQICENLYRFCKSEIKYREESEDDQTTALPTGILTRGEGDCKHYANFCGGVLDAINRLTGKKIKWFYRFASYSLLTKTPHHVFIVVMDGNTEIWIDPVPGADIMQPVWQLDKKIKSVSMPLYKNIGGFDRMRSRYYDSDVIGFVDPETAAAVVEKGGDIVDSIVKIWDDISDKVKNYPVKSQNTFNSLVNSIQEIIPLPPTSVAQARELLAEAEKQRTMAVARGPDRATLTVIMLLDEIIVALRSYIKVNGSYFGMPPPGSGSTGTVAQPYGTTLKTNPIETLTAGAFGGSSTTLLVLAGVGVGAYLLTRKQGRARSVHGKGNLLTTALVVGGSILLIRHLRTKQVHPAVGPENIAYDPGQALQATEADQNIFY